jgi:hypothetical protein
MDCVAHPGAKGWGFSCASTLDEIVFSTDSCSEGRTVVSGMIANRQRRTPWLRGALGYKGPFTPKNLAFSRNGNFESVISLHEKTRKTPASSFRTPFADPQKPSICWKNAENSPKIKSPPGGGSLHTSSTKKNSTTQNFVKRYFNLFLGGPIRLVFQNPHSHPPYPSSATKFLASA